MLGAMFGMGTGELILIAVVLIVLFGAKKLPQLGDGLGKALRGFQKAVSGSDEKPSKPLPDAETVAPSAEQKQS
jgi:sec-independent protein translocase protein TatA